MYDKIVTPCFDSLAIRQCWGQFNYVEVDSINTLQVTVLKHKCKTLVSSPYFWDKGQQAKAIGDRGHRR